MSRNRSIALIACVVLILVLDQPPHSRAGSGTAADPWRNNAIGYSWSYNGSIASINQEFTVTASFNAPSGQPRTQFWAIQPKMQSLIHMYVGVQKYGILLGDQHPNHEVATKSARFSLQSLNQAYIRNLDTGNCENGFDGGPGVSCAITYNYADGQKYRHWVNIYTNVTGTGWCPVGYTSCYVFQAMIAPASNLSAATQISAISGVTLAFGMPTSASSFVENFAVNHVANCTPIGNVEGQFVLPFKVNGSSVLYASSSGWDLAMSPQACVWTWNDWVTTIIRY